MKKQFLLCLACVPILWGCSFPAVSQSSSSSSLLISSSENEIEAIYRLYQANGGNLTYSEWLQSIKGEPGKDGVSVRVGTGAPAAKLGYEGDSYIDLSSFDFYVKMNGFWAKMGNLKGSIGQTGPQGPQGEQGEKGEKGDKGDRGASLLTGNGSPSPFTGIVGDSYVDLQTLKVYQKQENGWVLIGYLGGGGSGGNSSSSQPSTSSSAPQSSSYPAPTSIPASSSQSQTSQSQFSYDPLPFYVDFTHLGADDIELLVWCGYDVQSVTEKTARGFQAALKDAGYLGEVTFSINAVGEGDAASMMAVDVEFGADVYFFAQDQLARLNAAGALDEVPSYVANWVMEENTTGSLNAGTLNQRLMAYPGTEDNGYFMYYDKSVLKGDEIKSWEDIVAKAEAGEYEVDFDHGSAWYNFGFFYGAGADSIWEADSKGHFVSYQDTYNTAAGLIAARGLANIVGSPRMVNNSSVSGSGDKCIALVDGIWDYQAAKRKWGENLGCAELPYFHVNGQAYHTGSFSGNKLVGVKPQGSVPRSAIAHLFAAYLTSYEAQEARFDAKGWGPTNKALIASEKVQQSPQLTALAAQNAYSKPQGQFPGKWWDCAGIIGPYIAKYGKNATDEQLRYILENYAAELDTLLDL